MNDPMNVAMGARLGQARLAANMSIAQLADALGIGVEELEAYEAGAMRMPSSILVRICDTLAITPVSLFRTDRGKWH